MRFGLDSHTITASALPAKTNGEESSPIDGYVFEVLDFGCMILQGTTGASIMEGFLPLAYDAMARHELAAALHRYVQSPALKFKISTRNLSRQT